MRPAGLETVVALSGIQRGILAECLAAEGSAMYQVQSSFRLSGELDVPAMTRAWQALVARHQALRCSFFWEDLSTPVQAVHRRIILPVTVIDGTEDTLDDVRSAQRRAPFDLHRPPQLRVTLVRLSPTEHELIWTRHHLQVDGWSQMLLIEEVFRLYEAFALVGANAELDDAALLGPPTQLAPYISWLDGHAGDHAAFWRSYLDGVTPAARLTLPASHEQAERRQVLDADLSDRIEARSRAWSVTPAALYEAAWALTLAGDQPDRDEAVFGIAVSTRPPDVPNAERMIGLHISTVPLRVRLDPHAGLDGLARAIHAGHGQVMDGAHASPGDIAAASPLRPPERLYTSLVVVGNYPAEITRGDARSSLSVRGVLGSVQNSLPLTLRIMPGPPTVVAVLHDTGQLPAAQAARYARRFHQSLAALTADPPATVGQTCAALSGEQDSAEPAAVTAALLGHPAVSQAVAVRTSTGSVCGAVVPGGERGAALARALAADPPADSELFVLPDGMTVAHDDATMTRHLYHEIAVDECYLQHGVQLADGAVVLDIGANIGLFTTWVATHWRDTRIFAYEPVPATAALARWNAAAWAPGAVVTTAALARTSGEVDVIHYPGLSGASGRYADPTRDAEGLTSLALAHIDDGLAESDDATYVTAQLASRWQTHAVRSAATTISAEIARFGLDRVDLLKIDAEGSELDVLHGVTGTDWPRIRQVVLETHGPELHREAELLLRTQGFTTSTTGAGFHQNGLSAILVAVQGTSLPGAHSPRREQIVASRDLIAELRRDVAQAGLRLDALRVVGALPYTPAGAIDAAAFSAGSDADRNPREPQGPTNGLEHVITLVWRQLLPGSPAIGRDDNFFNLGGHSLLGIRATSRLRGLLPLPIPLGLLFEHPTPAGLAAAIADSALDPEAVHRAAAIVAEVASMSDTEVAAALSTVDGTP